MSTFEYAKRPLDTGKAEIRILYPFLAENQTQGGRAETEGVKPALPLDFTLKVVSLHDSNLKYTALSYRWGVDSKPILVNGQTLYVNENLYQALQHFDLDDISSGIWTDSICINQNDQKEKSDQVHRMRSIYQLAAKVIVWLGPAADESDIVMDLLVSIGKQCEKLKIPVKDPSGKRAWPTSPEDRRLTQLHDSVEKILQAMGHVKLAKAVNAFVEREWWRRVWVVQELALAKEAIFQAGMKRAVCDHVDVALFFWHHWSLQVIDQKSQSRSFSAVKQLDKDELFRCLTHGHLGLRARFMLSYRSSYLSQAGTEKITHLYEFLIKAYTHGGVNTSLEATEGKDRIFGLIGLVEEEYKNLGLKVDYEKSIEEIDMETTKALLKQGHVDLLLLIQPGRSCNTLSDLPSWCVDWRQEVWQPNPVYNLHNLYSASAETKPNVLSTVKYGDSRSITVSGTKIGPIDKIGGSYDISSSPSSPLPMNCIRLFSDIQKLCTESIKFGLHVYNAQEIKEVPWRVPIRDYETPPGSFANGPRIATAEVSRRRYPKIYSFFLGAIASDKFGDTFNNTARRGILSAMQNWMQRLYWLSVTIIFAADYGFARLRPVSCLRWWIKKKCLLLWSGGDAGKALEIKMDEEWKDITFDTPDMYKP